MENGNPGGTIGLQYWSAGEVVPTNKGYYLAWLEDGWMGIVIWNGKGWILPPTGHDISNVMMFWANRPDWKTLEANYGKEY
jgi:hypothetical protein